MITVTAIKFIGLLIITNLTNSGAEVVMGHVPVVTPTHDAIIAYHPADLVSATNWPKAGTFTSGGETYDYVIANKETITFSGPTDRFENLIGPMPHLSCCCPQMKGILPEYGNPEQPLPGRAAAHFMIDHGLYFTQTESDSSVSTVLAFAENKPLTITGVAGPVTRKLELKFGTDVLVSNTPLAALQGTHVPDSHDDFQAYYSMGIDSTSCTSMPSDSTLCRPREEPCRLVQETRAKVKRAKLTATYKKIQAAATRNVCGTCLVADINCSSSQWP